MKRKTILSYLFAIMLFIFPLISHAEEQSDEIYQKIQDKGVLTVGLSADYPPYEFHTTVNGKDKIVGIDISIAEKIADDLGVKLEIKEYGFDALLGALKLNNIDLIISSMTASAEREKEVNFSDSYIESAQRMIVRKEDAHRFKELSDLDGLKVGAQKQSTQEVLVQTQLPNAKIVSLQKFTDILLQLTEGKIEAAVVDGPVAEAYLSQTDGIAFAEEITFIDDEKGTAVAVSKEAPLLLSKVNESIATIRKDDLVSEYSKEAGTHMLGEQSFWDKYGNYYIKGTAYTLLLALVGVLCGAVIGALLALMKLSKNKLLKAIAFIYIEYVRGTPLLVQIFLVFFGTNALGLDLSALASSFIALSLNSAAYVAEIFRAGINAVDVGQTESARSLGMTQTQALKHIILPQAIKNVLPALGNEFVTVIKESSVVSVIGVSELMFQAGVVQGASFKPFLPIVLASLIYFFLTFTLSRLLGVAERKMNNA